MGAVVAILTVVGTLLLCGIVVWFVLRGMKNQAYQGVVTDKKEEEREGADDASYTVYSLTVKCDDGTQKKVTVGRKIWEQFAVGDKIIKEAGKYSPIKG